MVDATLVDLALLKSLNRNLGATVGTFDQDDLPLWEGVLKSSPEKFVNAAQYGYKKRQKMKTGRDEFHEQELKDFASEFLWKYFLVHVRGKECTPAHLIDMNLFDLSCQEEPEN